MRRTFPTALLSCFIFLSACQSGGPARPEGNATATPTATKAEGSETKGEEKMSLKLTSTAFDEGGTIPAQYTCDGQNISPPLVWSDLPDGAKSLALICDDPDAPRGTWVHWVVYQIPATEKGLPENLPPRETLDNGTRQGTNDFKKIGYGGPCPPSGTHRYFFKLYALDATLDISSGATKDQLLHSIEGHILAQGQLIGLYKRQ